MKFIDLERQYREYQNQLESQIRDVIGSTQFIMGPKVAEIEERLAEFTGAPHAIGVSSGTDALLLPLLAAEMEAGTGVITTPFTFAATAEVIVLAGCRPVFVDIEPGTMNISVEAVGKALQHAAQKGDKVSAIIPVSIFGVCPDMDRINELATDHDLLVIEDGCQSMGATYKGRRSCGISQVAATSFFPSKPLGAYGDGGMVFCQEQQLAEKIRALRCHGETSRYHHQWIGTNARLDAIQAAVLLAKLPHFQHEIASRQQAAQRYMDLIREAGLPEISFQEIPEECTSVYAQFTIRICNNRRDQVAEAMAKENIPTAIHYPRPLHLQPAFRFCGYEAGDFPVAEQVCSEVLSLPIHPFITASEQEQVVASLARAMKG